MCPFRAPTKRGEVQMVIEINRFANYLSGIAIFEGHIPGPSLKDAVAAVRRDPIVGSQIGSFPWIVKGIDPWGHPIVFTRSNDGYRAIIYSCGRNGLDEGGHGDDIGQIIDISGMKGAK
jgi:hypothetical protein